MPIVDPKSPSISATSKAEKIDISDVEIAFCDLKDSFRAYECLQSFLSPRYPLRGIDEFHIEPVELRGPVTVLNADMERHLLTLRGAIDEVRVKTGGIVPRRA
ncbi:hypothetical protein [Variovorax sp. J31P207]|uniref:hypothetical protein n=1 Tax=Variovorax sp. J31P207 TaxID=3053510 RepID=UPI0025760FB7|nr:hypothetical protein [Variovorax sp. J31P207]MDM0067258.1 hypothetical protein [Variovorax sp. J31P207]